MQIITLSGTQKTLVGSCSSIAAQLIAVLVIILIGEFILCLLVVIVQHNLDIYQIIMASRNKVDTWKTK